MIDKLNYCKYNGKEGYVFDTKDIKEKEEKCIFRNISQYKDDFTEINGKLYYFFRFRDNKHKEGYMEVGKENKIVNFLFDKVGKIEYRPLLDKYYYKVKYQGKYGYLELGEDTNGKCIFENSINIKCKKEEFYYYKAKYHRKRGILILGKENEEYIKEKCIFDEISKVKNEFYGVRYQAKHNRKRGVLTLGKESKENIKEECIFDKIKSLG